MFHSLSKILSGLILLLPLTSIAEIVHWEVHQSDDPVKIMPMGQNFVLSGSFDFNTETNSVFNITVQTSGTDCVACNDFADGGTGQTFLTAEGWGGVHFMENYGPDPINDPNGLITGRHYQLQIGGNRGFGGPTIFDVSQPGTYSDLDLEHSGYIFLSDPLDPDYGEQLGCNDCAFAIGTLIPIPEPEAYALMLAGLGMLGWQSKRKNPLRRQKNPSIKRS